MTFILHCSSSMSMTRVLDTSLFLLSLKQSGLPFCVENLWESEGLLNAVSPQASVTTVLSQLDKTHGFTFEYFHGV